MTTENQSKTRSEAQMANRTDMDIPTGTLLVSAALDRELCGMVNRFMTQGLKKLESLKILTDIELARKELGLDDLSLLGCRSWAKKKDRAKDNVKKSKKRGPKLASGGETKTKSSPLLNTAQQQTIALLVESANKSGASSVQAEKEAKAKARAEKKAEKEAKAKALAEKKAKIQAEKEAKAKSLAEKKAKIQAEKEAKAKARAEKKAKIQAEKEAKAKARAEKKAAKEAKIQAEKEAKAKARAEKKAKAKAEQEAKAKAEQEAETDDEVEVNDTDSQEGQLDVSKLPTVTIRGKEYLLIKEHSGYKNVLAEKDGDTARLVGVYIPEKNDIHEFEEESDAEEDWDNLSDDEQGDKPDTDTPATAEPNDDDLVSDVDSDVDSDDE